MEVNNFDSFNRYCGPAVLSIFTGATVDECAEEISKVQNKFKVAGVQPEELMKAGNAMGLEFQEIPSLGGRSIFWAGSVLIKLPPTQYYVSLGGHTVALEVRDGSLYLCDNHSKTEIELSNSARLSQKIVRIHKVIKVREYSRPTIVKSEHVAERYGMDVSLKVIHTLSDGGIKIMPLGSFRVSRPSELQDIAYAIMKLGDDV